MEREALLFPDIVEANLLYVHQGYEFRTFRFKSLKMALKNVLMENCVI